MRLARPFGLRFRRIEALRLVALLFLVFAVWASIFDKWTPAQFKNPIGYTLDGMFSLGQIKAAEQGFFLPFVPKNIPTLGAPAVANWDDFPQTDDFTWFFWGQVARLTDVLVAMNLAFCTSALASAAMLYLVARWLRLRWEAAFVGAALYGLTPFLFYRSVHHFTLNNHWHIPLLVPLALWVGGKRGLDLTRRDRRFWWAIALAAIPGFYNPYYLNYFMQVLGLCLLAQLFRRRWRAAAAAVVVLAVSFSCFLLNNVDTLSTKRARGPNPVAAARGPAEVEVYALRPYELFVPGPRHRLDVFAAAAERHKRSVLNVAEFPSMYLGVVVGFAFVWLMARGLRAALLGKPAGWGRFALFSAWLIFVAIDGGLMQIFQQVTNHILFRSNNRSSIFLFMFAALFLARLLTTLGRRAPSPVLWGVGVAALAWGLYDQTPSQRIDPNIPHWETVVQREEIARSDRRLTERFEQAVPEGTMVFQLPAIPYPEAGFYGRLPDYDQFRPWLHSKHLRFSYGAMKGRPEADFQMQVSRRPLPDMVRELERVGFGGLYVLKHAYSPQVVAQLQAELRAMGRTEIFESDSGDTFFVKLQPAGTPSGQAP